MSRNKYIKIKPEEAEKAKSAENEIRISTRRRPNSYIIYAAVLFLEKQFDTVVLKGIGETIPQMLMVADVLRRRIKGIHQVNTISSINVQDIYEPLEEGLDTVIVTRTLSMLEVKLTTKPSAEDLKAAGYQKPIPDEDVQ